MGGRSRRPPISLDTMVARTEGSTCSTSLGFVHRSRTVFCRAVPNLRLTIRNFCIAVCRQPQLCSPCGSLGDGSLLGLCAGARRHALHGVPAPLHGADIGSGSAAAPMEQICALLESSAVTAPAASAAGKGDSLSPRPSFNILGDTPLLTEAPESYRKSPPPGCFTRTAHPVDVKY